MATEEDNNEKAQVQVRNMIQNIFYPSSLTSFRDTLPSGQIIVGLHTGATAPPREIILQNMFPFMTLQDLKIALYIKLGKEAWAAPESMYLCLHGTKDGLEYFGKKVSPVDFTWNPPGTSKKRPFLSPNPFEGVKSIDRRFVEANGDMRLVHRIQRERLTLEDMFLKGGGAAEGIPTFHAYAFKDVFAASGLPAPIGKRDWNGRFVQYYPFLDPDMGAQATPGQLEHTERLATIFKRRQDFIGHLERILQENTRLQRLRLTYIKRLQLIWPKAVPIPGIEAQFYEVPVNERRPFMRLIPVEGSAISKVFLKNGKTPDIKDPKLLVQWASERSPSEENDYAFAKFLVQKGGISEPPIYSTLRLFDDGSADCILEPPRGIDKLEPRTHLYQFDTALLEGVKDIRYLNGAIPDIKNANVVLEVKLEKGFNQNILRERLPVFSAFFQEIAPLPNERPLVMLRYKLVSNFAVQNRIQTFISQVLVRRGRDVLQNLGQIVADEFEITLEEATNHATEFLKSDSKIVMVDPEMKDYKKQNVYGIDIAIYGDHPPSYTCHLYNVNSLENLQRIITILSILMSADKEDLEVGKGAVKQLLDAEAKEVGDDANGFESVGTAEPETNVPPALTSAQEAPADVGAAEGFYSNLDEFEIDAEDFDYGDEEGSSAAAAVTNAKDVREEPAVEEKPHELQKLEMVESNGRDTKLPSIANYFINRLHDADKRLVGYTTKQGQVPSNKGATEKGQKNAYSSKCQVTDGRQPNVLSEEKFQQIREEYEKDGVVFQIFPLMPGEPATVPGKVEKDYYTVLRYGTDPKKQNYYFCCKYFCVKDEMLIREVDLNSTEMRRYIRRPDGTRVKGKKEPGECPFCRGKIIENPKNPGIGQTIIKRNMKKSGTHETAEKYHFLINFLKATPHPEGFHLPCCFTDKDKDKGKDKDKDNIQPIFFKEEDRKWGLQPKPVSTEKVAVEAAPIEKAAAADEAANEAAAPTAPSPLTDYFTVLAGVTRRNIVGSEKVPLHIDGKGEPQIGLLPPALDEYFSQDQTKLVSRTFNPQKIKPGAAGFLRVAADNHITRKNDALLSALAPFFSLNSAEQMKAHILQRVPPKVFVHLNYGNLLLEFYDPVEMMSKFRDRTQLVNNAAAWSEAEGGLGVVLQRGGENEEAVVRAYLSYMAFETWLNSTETKKEFRHFALMFAQSGLMRNGPRPGITFIVLDVLNDDTIRVRCPPYGFNAELMAKNDIAFLMHHHSGVWEPIFYVDNRVRESGQDAKPATDIFTLIFQSSVSNMWPNVVQQRYEEFTNRCAASGRAVYASQSPGPQIRGPLSASLIPASILKRMEYTDARFKIEAVVRDSYNHLACLLIRARSGTGESIPHLFPVPVADDGILFFDKELVMDWEDFQAPPVDKLLLFYKEVIQPKFQIYPGYSLWKVVKNKRTEEIVAVQMKNGLFLPAGRPSSDTAAQRIKGAPSISVGEFEWNVNHDIILMENETEIPGEAARIEAKEFQEVFEHLRLTFSNWLAVKELGGRYREHLEATIFNKKLPLFEKRKRLQILLEPEIAAWLTTDFADEDAEGVQHHPSLIRTDCRIRGEGTCSGRCVWKQEAQKCLLHVPTEIAMGTIVHDGRQMERRVSAPVVLLYRLIEELLRYGERRRQLMEQGVSLLSSIENPVTLNIPGSVSKQVIYPEKNVAWFDLLRLEWARKTSEKPKFIEEMSRKPSAARTAAPVAPAVAPAVAPVASALDEKAALPAALVAALQTEGPDAKVAALRLLHSPLASILVPLKVKPKQLAITDNTMSLSEEMMRELARMTGRVIVQYDLRDATNPVIQAKKPATRVVYPTVPVFVILPEGPALLVKDPPVPTFLAKEEMPAPLLRVVQEAAS